MGIVLGDEYFENPVFSEDAEKNLIMWHAYEREYELRQELAVLEARYENFVIDGCCPDYDGPDYSGLAEEIERIYKELASLVDGTIVTMDEYETAKKNLH